MAEISTWVILYPATFWPHKNHKYVIDVIHVTEKENYILGTKFSPNTNIKALYKQMVKIKFLQVIKYFLCISKSLVKYN